MVGMITFEFSESVSKFLVGIPSNSLIKGLIDHYINPMFILIVFPKMFEKLVARDSPSRIYTDFQPAEEFHKELT